MIQNEKKYRIFAPQMLLRFALILIVFSLNNNAPLRLILIGQHTWGVFSLYNNMKKDYNKPPLSFQEQLEKLKAKGLVIRDEDYALKKLSQISYFRLSAYFLPYQSKKDKFNGTVDFKQYRYLFF